MFRIYQSKEYLYGLETFMVLMTICQYSKSKEYLYGLETSVRPVRQLLPPWSKEYLYGLETDQKGSSNQYRAMV